MARLSIKHGSCMRMISAYSSSQPFQTMSSVLKGIFLQLVPAKECFHPAHMMHSHRFSVLQAVSQHGSFQSIAVPSRLYFTRTTDKPLAGLRISIKDNYDLEGIRTTMTNRAYNELYHPRSSSADYIVKLIGLGAVIVGKTKMSAFASAEDPTDQWIDYHCPVNPRGDMYQTPSCSSTGAGASLAGYAWLDHAIGSDSEFWLDHRITHCQFCVMTGLPNQHPAVYACLQPSMASSAFAPRMVSTLSAALCRVASESAGTILVSRSCN